MFCPIILRNEYGGAHGYAHRQAAQRKKDREADTYCSDGIFSHQMPDPYGVNDTVTDLYQIPYEHEN
jgi:hypothetical protein